MSWVISNFHIFFRSLWLSRRRTPCRIWKWRKRNGSSRGDALRLRTKLEHLPKCLAISNSLPLLLPFYTLPTPSPSPRVWYFPSLVLSEVTYLLFTKCYLFFFLFWLIYWFISVKFACGLGFEKNGVLVWIVLLVFSVWVLFASQWKSGWQEGHDSFYEQLYTMPMVFLFFFFCRRGRRLYL